MATKTITIMEDAYEMLLKQKYKGESFSDTIRRISAKKKDISEFFGIWNDEYADAIQKNVDEMKARSIKRQLKRDKKFTA